jgi:predicted hydrocarbon binding protein
VSIVVGPPLKDTVPIDVPRIEKEGEYANKIFRAMLLGLEDTLGKNGTVTVLRQANLPQYVDAYPPDNMERGGHRLFYLAQINKVVFNIYGARGARAILARLGRKQARNGIEANPTLANATKMALKLMPRFMQARLILETASREIPHQLDTYMHVTEQDGILYYDDYICPHCLGWHSENALCYGMNGMMQGFVSWAIDSDDFKSEEIMCRAKGDPVCRFKITI